MSDREIEGIQGYPGVNLKQQENIQLSLSQPDKTWQRDKHPFSSFYLREVFLDRILTGQITPEHYSVFLGSIRRRNGMSNSRLDSEQLFNEINDPLFAPPQMIRQMKGVLSWFVSGNLDGRSNLTAAELNAFLTSIPGKQILEFDKQREQFLDIIEKSNDLSKRKEYEAAVDKFGMIVYGKQWEYLKQIRLLEKEAKDRWKVFREEDWTGEKVKTGYLLRHNDASDDVSRKVDVFEKAVAEVATLPGVDMQLAKRHLAEIVLKESIDLSSFAFGYPWRAPELLMKIYSRNPELVIQMAKDHIRLAHGAGSASFLGFLRYGLRPQAFLEDQNQLIAGGEGVFGAAGINREHLSTLPWDASELGDYYQTQPLDEEFLSRKIAFLTTGLADPENWLLGKKPEEQTVRGSPRHSSQITLESARKTLAFLQKPDKTSEERVEAQLIRLNFPMLYMMPNESSKGKQVGRLNGGGIDLEMPIKGGFSQQEVGIILVPEERVDITKDVIRHFGFDISVFSIDAYRKANERF